MSRAYLVLEDGSVFEGESFGAAGETLGELVFATGMTGYQETITDPSYAGQIVLQTSPHIGIVGMNKRDEESGQIWVAGYVVKEPSRVSSNWRAESTLDTELRKAGVIGISDIDTRAITLRIRDRGAMRAGIFSGETLDQKIMLEKVKSSAQMSGQFLSDVVSTNQIYRIPPTIAAVGKVAILDLGVKKSTLEHLSNRGLEVIVFPASATAKEILEHKPDGNLLFQRTWRSSGERCPSRGLERTIRAWSSFLWNLLWKSTTRESSWILHLQACFWTQRNKSASHEHRVRKG